MAFRAQRALLLTLVVGACGGDTSGDASPNDGLRPLAVREELTIGSLDDPEIGFSRIGGVALGPDGLIYVLEGQDQEIRVYDERGRRLRTIGRRGSGPGEFERASLLGFKGDTLWVNDPGAQRVTLFGREGEVLSSFRVGTVTIDADPGVFLRVSSGALRDDGLLDPSINYGFILDGDLPDSVLAPRLVFDREGEIVDTAGYEARYLPSAERISLGGRDVFAPAAPSDAPLYLAFPDGIAVVERAAASTESDPAFTVTRTRAVGDTVYHRRFVYPPRPFEPPFIDSLVQRSVPFAVRVTGLDTSTVERAFRNALELPPYQTPVLQAVAGVDGSLWLRREDDGGPSVRWMVLGADGGPLGAVELPRGATIHRARADVVHVAEPDPFGIPWLVRYRVVGAEAGGGGGR